MLLAIDIGNTNIAFGVWDGRAWRYHWRVVTESDRSEDEYREDLSARIKQVGLANGIDSVVMSSVVPVLSPIFSTIAVNHLGRAPLQVTHELNIGIELRVDYPEALGADRIANAVAAYHYNHGPSIVVDMGTATKFDVVSSDGALVGGVISPGLQLTADALAERAAKLNPVTLEAPAHTIGRNTVQAMQSGLVYGYVCLIEGMIARILSEHPDQGQPIPVLGTGGLIELVASHTEVFDHIDHHLTLSGLRLIYDRVKG